MLKSLRIHNLILIESADIVFENNLNVLSGETGSGKSALMHALGLVAGDRTDVGMIRRGCEKGSVEATFVIDHIPALSAILEESGIDHEKGEELIIRREMVVSGKSRCFINHQAAQQTLLKKIGSYLIDIVSQHATQRLFSLEQHRILLDLFGGLTGDAEEFKSAWERETTLRSELEKLRNSEAERVREIGVCEMELEELEEARLREGEEEEIFAEYTLLANAEDLSTKVKEVMNVLSGERNPIVSQLHRQKTTFDQLIAIDPSLKEAASSYQNAVLELEEIAYTLRDYQSRIHYDPDKLQRINTRLTLINKLKRKYGSAIADINTYHQRTKAKLKALENADCRIEELAEELEMASQATNSLANTLSNQRKQAAKQLDKALTEQLQTLNMAKAEFIVEVTSLKRCNSGDDRIEFFLVPNVGEHRIAIKDGVSGGEMSRVLLALQTLLTGKTATPTLIFDEIDANIGGATAVVIGNKLKEISWQHQVLCITHFPQVASQADHHLQIAKEEHAGRTVSRIRSLDLSAREEELLRMVGATANTARQK
jgi:DNA repair protein RecN (Recombination protein N)